ncbi:hypothetical protein PUR59_00405 [Streptomyces sp. SP18ES09]|uniref:hypothetical protein n=1 Tax=Streptomyces sp. SP18ES09 TaxID=3002532 RepID=UPI002E78DC6E|nr:hypothetical protein [Streptomyces sp. SP18ES09]MEE1813512.1 hypothetical protein [Streptomyces sp. SP18ES09]
MNPNSTSPEGLSARETAERGEKVVRDADATPGPQKAAQDLDPRAVLLDTISTALNAAGYWLPADGKKAVAEAVLATVGKESELLRRAADPQDLRMVDEMLDELRKLTAAQAAISSVRSLARKGGDFCADCARAVLDALTAHQPKEQP